MLKMAEASKVTLDDVKTHISQMRISVEFSLATDKLSKERDNRLKARLQNYILLENLFSRPERAKQMLDQYTKVKN